MQQLMHIEYRRRQTPQLISRILNIGVMYQICQKAMNANSQPHCAAMQHPQHIVIKLQQKIFQLSKHERENVQTQSKLCVPSGSPMTSLNSRVCTCKVKSLALKFSQMYFYILLFYKYLQYDCLFEMLKVIIDGKMGYMIFFFEKKIEIYFE